MEILFGISESPTIRQKLEIGDDSVECEYYRTIRNVGDLPQRQQEKLEAKCYSLPEKSYQDSVFSYETKVSVLDKQNIPNFEFTIHCKNNGWYFCTHKDQQLCSKSIFFQDII